MPNREDLFDSHGGGYNAQKRAFDAVGEGEVIVIEARGEAGSGTLGDVLAIRAHARGAAGIVTDGGVRDAEAVASVGIPVFSNGAHPAVLGRKHVPWDADVTIGCGGTTVQPGDIIVGDADGVIVIPPAPRRGGRRRRARAGGRGRLDRRARRGRASRRRTLPDERRVASEVPTRARHRTTGSTSAGAGQSKSQRAYQWIKERIARHEYTPGYRLVLGTIAGELDMSVVPVREAVRQLEAEGLVTFERNVGARVTLVDESEYVNTMQTLGIVEGAATALSAPLLTPEDLGRAATSTSG